MLSTAATARWLVMLGVLALPGFALAAEAARPAPKPKSRPAEVVYLQSWFGAVDTDQSWELPEDENGGPYTGSVGTLPYIGGSQLTLHGAGFRYGYEAGGYIGWKDYDVAFRSGADGLRVAIAGSLFSFELFLGGVLAYEPRPDLRLYAAAGPAVTWMQLDNDDEQAEVLPASNVGPSGIFISVNTQEDDVSVMPYARVGFDFQLKSGYSWGLSVRYAPHDFDFGSSGELEFDGVQYFLIVGVRR